MSLLTKDSRASLSSAHEPPCLSLYQPTHRHYPGHRMPVTAPEIPTQANS